LTFLGLQGRISQFVGATGPDFVVVGATGPEFLFWGYRAGFFSLGFFLGLERIYFWGFWGVTDYLGSEVWALECLGFFWGG
jgi:hypothetical protein